MNALQIVLLVFAALLLLLLTLLFLPVRLALSFDQKITVRLRILFFSFPIYPKKKKWKMKEHLPEYQKQRKKKKNPPVHKETVSYAKKEGPVEKIKRQYEEISSLLNRVIFPIAERLGKNLRVKIRRLEVQIASADAAKTALLYAAAVNGGYALLAAIDEYANLKLTNNGRVEVQCRYDLKKSTLACDLEIGTSLYGALYTLLPVLLNYLKTTANEDI